MDTLLLWMIPLLLAIAFLVLKRFVRSNFLVGGYFIAVGVVFYIVKFGARVSMDTLRSRGWVFDAPSSSNPWYHFYTLYGGYLPAIPIKHELTVCRFFGRRLVRIR
jgi:SulP family sulfate permease